MGWQISHVFEFLVLGDANFLTIFPEFWSEIVINQSHKVNRLSGCEPTNYTTPKSSVKPLGYHSSVGLVIRMWTLLDLKTWYTAISGSQYFTNCMHIEVSQAASNFALTAHTNHRRCSSSLSALLTVKDKDMTDWTVDRD